MILLIEEVHMEYSKYALEKVEANFDRVTQKSKVHESSLYIENSDSSLSWSKIHGNKSLDTPILLASVTKLFTTTCVLKLIEKGRLKLDNNIKDFLDKELLTGLHIYKGIDYSYDITIRNLLCQTSGLPDFYLDGKKSVFKRFLKEDFAYDFYDELQWVKNMEPYFKPGSKNKAYYSDINFDILGYIIEKIVEKPLN